MQQAVGELESQLRHVTNLLAEFKHRAYMAEVRLLCIILTFVFAFRSLDLP